MGSIFGGKPDTPAPPPIPEPIVSEPISDPDPKGQDDPDVQERAKRLRIAAARRSGRASTILTGPQGVPDDDNISVKQLGAG
ncbi:MAG: hypothetical protein ABGX63_02565 [bacterium]|jgi:hypothetical protein